MSEYNAKSKLLFIIFCLLLKCHVLATGMSYKLCLEHMEDDQNDCDQLGIAAFRMFLKVDFPSLKKLAKREYW